CFALSRAVVFHQWRLEMQAAQERAEATIVIATEQGFPQFRAFSALLRGWALAHQGQAQDGIAQIEQGLTAYNATGSKGARPYGIALLAEVHGTVGEQEIGLTVLAEALTVVEKTGARWYEPELYRVKGALLLQQSSSNQTEAASCFHHAIAIAQEQSAKS